MITAFFPVGLTSNRSRSSGQVWFTLLSVTVTLATVPPKPDTRMVEGYVAAGPLETRMGDGFVNDVPVAAAVTMTRVEAVTLDKLAVTFALPSATALTSPVLLIVATADASELHAVSKVTSWLVPSLKVPVA